MMIVSLKQAGLDGVNEKYCLSDTKSTIEVGGIGWWVDGIGLKMKVLFLGD